jgi:hypothetical protein
MDCCSINTYSFDWVAISAIGVAIISVVFGIRFNRRTLRLTEAHNKKTVEPLITDLFVLDAMIVKAGHLDHRWPVQLQLS